MAAPKKLEETPTPPQAGWLRRTFGALFTPAQWLKEPTFRRTLYAVGMIVLGGGLCAAIWRNVREDVQALPEYQVTVGELHVTAPPAWLDPKANVRAAVVRDASLEGRMSLLDTRLTIDIARAFALHPWVEEVVGVRKSYPARLDVELHYRRPACVVQTARETYVVDSNGVLLPRADVRPEELAVLPKLSGVDAPTGLVGTVWNDPRVIDGAAIASVLRQEWPALGLESIRPITSNVTKSGTRYAFGIRTLQGREIEWGYAPKAPSAEDKDLAWKLGEIRNFQKQQQAPVRGSRPSTMEPTKRVEDLTLRLDRGQR